MANLVKKIKTTSGDAQIDYNALANLPDLKNMFSNPNLLTNSDFRKLVNQRGLTTYAASDDWTYCIDRWRTKGLSVTVNDGSITVTNNGSSQGSIQQPIGYYFPTGKYTLSCKVVSCSGNVSMGATNTSNNPKLSVGVNSRTWDNVTIGSVAIALDANASVTLEWVKLEYGSVATPLVPRAYAEELALCQRYYEKRTVIFFPYNGEVPAKYYIAVNGDSHRVTKHREPSLSFSQFTDHNNIDVQAALDSSKTTQTKDYIRMITLTNNCSEFLLRSTIEFDAEIY